ncbi:hypothetical protein L6R50_00310 [Myxococcota bacterium]|nr:hypothetical protein [Myxococcota bacterium]
MTPSEPPYDLGASYWEIAPGNGATGTLRLAATGDQGARWGVVAAALLGDGPARLASARGPSGEAVAVEVDLEGAERVLVGVANLGPSGLDAEDEPERRGFELVAELRAPDPADDDDSASGEDEPTSGCQGCDSAGGPGRAPAAALLLLAASRRRRSRTATP